MIYGGCELGASSSLPGFHIVNRTRTSATNSIPRTDLPVLNLQDVLYRHMGLGLKFLFAISVGGPGGRVRMGVLLSSPVGAGAIDTIPRHHG